MSDYRYNAVVRAVHDGDSLSLDVDLGFGTWIRGRAFRLFGINAPELGTRAGKDARAYLLGLLPVGTPVELESIKDRPDKYGGRYLGIIRINGLVSVNDLLVKEGHAVSWDGKGAKPVPAGGP